MVKRKVFIGSSKESLPVAYAVQENLEHIAEVTVWDQDIFKPSAHFLEAIEEALDHADIGVFILANDDMAQIRDTTYTVARDNVVFELGVFMGRLGRDNCFFITPRGLDDFHLPSDLLGVIPLTYEPKRNDGNVRAALAPVCNNIARSIAALPDHVHHQASYDLRRNKFPSKRLVRYLDTACLFRDRTAFNNSIGYQKLFVSAKSIKAIGISLNALTINWGIGSFLQKLESLESAQLLFLNPDGRVTHQREQNEKLPNGTIANVTKTNLTLIESIAERASEEKRGKLEWRLYDSMVNLNMYIIDDSYIILQHYLSGLRGQECPVYVLRNESHQMGLFDVYCSVFDSTWNQNV